MNPSQYWLKLVNKNLAAKKLPFDAAWRLTSREHPDAATLMSAFGVTRAQVNFFNSRRENQPAAEELSEFQRNVLGSKAKQFANSQAGGAARSPQFVKILTIGDRLAENKQFANEDPVPVGHAKMYRLFWLPSTITQEQWQAAWVGNGSTATPMHPGKIFAALVDWAKGKYGLDYDAAIARCKADFPELWAAVETLAKPIS